MARAWRVAAVGAGGAPGSEDQLLDHVWRADTDRLAILAEDDTQRDDTGWETFIIALRRSMPYTAAGPRRRNSGPAWLFGEDRCALDAILRRGAACGAGRDPVLARPT